MALGAAAGAVEILLPGLGVSRLQIGGIDVAPVAEPVPVEPSLPRPQAAKADAYAESP